MTNGTNRGEITPEINTNRRKHRLGRSSQARNTSWYLLSPSFWIALCCLSLMPMVSIGLWAQETKIFRAGASTSNVTPPLGGILVGGYGAPVANHIHDELHARSLVLD